jgi:hypothetical protein
MNLAFLGNGACLPTEYNIYSTFFNTVIQNTTLTAMHWTKRHGLRRAARWNSGECFAGRRHAKRFDWWLSDKIMFRHKFNSLRLAIQPFKLALSLRISTFGWEQAALQKRADWFATVQDRQNPDLANSMRGYTTATVCGGTLHFGDR